MTNLAERLWQARVRGGTVDRSDVTEPASLDEAYAVQAAVIQRLGHPTAGYKVGSTSKEAQRILGTTEPGACPVPAPYLHASPARLTIVAAQGPAIEGEFAFRLGKDLPPRDAPYDRADVTDAVDAVAGAIEVVGSRLAGGLAGKGRYFTTADCGANIALVVGPWTTDWQSLDLPAHHVGIRIDGKPAGSGTGARALGDPMNVLVWLANHLSATGVGLTSGLCISTGTCTGLDQVAPGNRVVADFGSLGAVEIAFQ